MAGTAVPPGPSVSACAGAGRDACGACGQGWRGRSTTTAGAAVPAPGMRHGRLRACELGCGYAKAAAGSRSCCCCTAWAPPAMYGRGGGRCSPAVAGTLAGARPARPRRLAAATGLCLRVLGRRGRPYRQHQRPHRRAGAFAGRRRRPGAGQRRVHRAGAGGHRPGDQGRLDAEELDRAQAASRRPPAWFTSREEAAARYLRFSGLAGLLADTDLAVDAGLTEEHGRWRLAMDPGCVRRRRARHDAHAGRISGPVLLACGEHDAMNTGEQLGRLGVPRDHPGPQRTRGEPTAGDHGPGPVPMTPGGYASTLPPAPTPGAAA